ncbi:MAG: glycerophosphodiester phosphodiesterase [Acidimicrobiia bacterium]
MGRAQTPITFAHRGGRGDAPENSIAAFSRSLALGARGLESDARLSGDGEVVLIHGSALRQRWRRLPVRELSANRLAEMGVSRLDDLYAECGSNYELSLDLKDPEVVAPLVEVAARAEATERLWLCSNDLDVLERVRRDHPAVRVVHSMGRGARSDGLERHVAALAASGVAALNLHEAAWTLGLVTLTRRFGLLSFAWDAQEARRIRALLDMGVDAVYSDHVERMLATVGEWSTGDDPAGI